MTKLLLPDGEGTVCRHTTYNPKDDGQFPWDRCEEWAEVSIDRGEAMRFFEWIVDHPRAIIGLDQSAATTTLYLCQHHTNVWRDLV